MSYRELSTWIVLAAVGLCAVSYGLDVRAQSLAIGALAPPHTPELIKTLVVLIILLIVGQILAVILFPREADSRLDERERSIAIKSANIGGHILGFGVIVAGGHYIVHGDGDGFFYAVLGSLVIAQLVECGAEIFHLRYG